MSGSLTDFNSSGYEARVTANLKPNWRLVINYSYNDSGRSQLYKDAIPWYGMKLADGVLLKQGVSQNAAGQFVVDPGAYEAGRTVAKWIELGAMRPAANPSTLTTSAGVAVARELFNLVDNTKIIPQRLLRADDYQIPGGRGPGYGRYDLVEPRDIRFTTTYSF